MAGGLHCANAAYDASERAWLGLIVAAVSRSCRPIIDPLFAEQWSLLNTGQAGATSGEDLNVAGAWNAGLCGGGVRIAVVDDGLEAAHENLLLNVEHGASFDFSSGGADPSAGGTRGTAAAGLIGGAGDSLGMRGAAPRAYLRAYNLLQNRTAANEALAMTRDIANLSIVNNSWGPTDLTGLYASATAAWEDAVTSGLANGRNGRGAIYVFAAGDGGRAVNLATEIDDSNLNGYANHYGVFAIGSFGSDGKRAAASEQGANLLVSAPGGSATGGGVITSDQSGSAGLNSGASATDLGNVNYTNAYGGTGAAAALASGAIALILEANPELSWRDVKLILAQSARKNDPADSDWAVNAAGLNINHKYGFGALNAAAAVELARNWTRVGPQLSFQTATDVVGSAISDGGPGAAAADNTVVAGSGIGQIEFVEVEVTFTHPYPGDVRIMLQKGAGTQAILARPRSCRSAANSATIVACSPTTMTYRLGANRFLGESADGTWTLTLQDMQNTASLGGAFTINGNGTFSAWRLKFYGR